MKAVTTWFAAQCRNPVARPVRAFYIGGSDHGSRVSGWPDITRSINDLSSVKPTVDLDNADGLYNSFWRNTISLTNTVDIRIGLTHPNSATEYLTLYTGEIETVEYSEGKMSIKCKDRLSYLEDATISAVDSSDTNVVSFAAQAPSSLAWTICTCYGGLSSAASVNNPDIDYAIWSAWAGYFEASNIQVEANASGEQVIDVLTTIADYTFSSICVEGDGKIKFRKRSAYSDTASLARLLPQDIKSLGIIVSTDKLTNKPWVYGGYVPDSQTYGIQVYEVDSVSVNSYGEYESTLESTTLWYTTSLAASFVAESILFAYSEPQPSFDIEANGLGMIWLELADQVSFADSFYGINSFEVWRVTEYTVSLQDGTCTYRLEGGGEYSGYRLFRLNVSSLDGSDVLG